MRAGSGIPVLVGCGAASHAVSPFTMICGLLSALRAFEACGRTGLGEGRQRRQNEKRLDAISAIEAFPSGVPNRRHVLNVGTHSARCKSSGSNHSARLASAREAHIAQRASLMRQTRTKSAETVALAGALMPAPPGRERRARCGWLLRRAPHRRRRRDVALQGARK